MSQHPRPLTDEQEGRPPMTTKLPRPTDIELRERVDELVAWANSRISVCREQENKFGRGLGEHGSHGPQSPPQALIEAWIERRALQAVLAILGRS